MSPLNGLDTAETIDLTREAPGPPDAIDDRLSSLTEFATDLASTTDERAILERAARYLRRFLASDRTSVALADETGDLSVVALSGDGRDFPVGSLVPSDDALPSTPNRAFAAKRLVTADLAATNPGAAFVEHGLRYVMCAPLPTGGAPIGTLNAGRGAAPFSPAEQALFSQVCALVASSVERARLTVRMSEAAEAAQREAAALAVLHEMASRIAAALDRRSVFEVVATLLPTVLPSDRVSYLELAPDGDGAIIWGTAGTSGALQPGGRLPTMGSCFGIVAERRDLVRFEDLASADLVEGPKLVEMGLRSAMAVPVLDSGVAVGTINVASRNAYPFGQLDETVLRLTGRLVGVTIERIRTTEDANRALAESEARLREIIDLVPSQIFAKDAAGRFALANRALADAYGTDVDSIIGRTEADLRGHSRDVLHSRWIDRQVMTEQKTCTVPDVPMTLADGSEVLLHTTKIPYRLGRGDEPAVLGVALDVTAWRRAESALERSEQRFRALYDDNPTTLVTIGPDGRIVTTNRFGATQLGYQPVELVGWPFWELHDVHEQAQVRAQVSTALAMPIEHVARWEGRLQSRDGREIWTRQTARTVKSPDGTTQLLVVCEDVSEVHQLSERLRHQATHDLLTGLFNRAELERRLSRAIDTSKQGARHVLCFLDLDHFKVVNDTCGHGAGDALLRQLSGLLASQLDAEHMLARFGGDEFALLIENMRAVEAEPIVEQLRRAIEGADFRWGGRPFHVTASIGLVELDETIRHPGDALSAADSACFAAKDGGRNRIEIWAPSEHLLISRRSELEWPGRMRAALDADRFVLMAQPLVRLDPDSADRDTVHGFELLVRLRDDDGSLLLPGAFLPATERYNLAPRLDRWVLEQALTVLSAHSSAARQMRL
ncbi:MAG: diguanylate cyclase, partial [Acidimicrobiia bacterium]|nr:diguanylate cyclase [Acidimicrobiia bacterium]